MKVIVLFAVAALLTCCGTSTPVTANPDRGTTTSGTAGSAKVTDGTVNEGMNATRSMGADSVKKGRDSVHLQ